MSSVLTCLQSVMEYVGIANLLTAITLCLLTFWFYRTNYRASFYYHLPPGPPVIPYPFDGIMAMFPTSNRSGRMIQISKRYGDIACVQLGKKLMILISSPCLVKELLVKQADVTSNRETPPFLTHVVGFTGGIIFNEGTSWQEIRRFSLSALRNFGMGQKAIETRIQEEASILCNAVAQHSGEAFDAMHLTQAAVSNIICSITFGRRLEYDDPVFVDMIRRLRELISRFGINPVVRELMERFPFLINAPLMKSAKDNLLGLKDFINKEVTEHIQSYDSNDIRDIIDMYLTEAQRLEKEDGTKPYMTKEEIWMCVFDLFMAGTETTSSSLLWFILVMASKANVQEKVIDEIDRVVGSERALCWNDRKDMPYTDATMMEVLRYRPVVPMGIPHVTAEDVGTRGYTIPKNTEVLINIIGIHLDPRYWDDPEEFNPGRFLSENGRAVIKQDAFTVFGAGRRVCLGEQLAQMELFLFATTLVQRFRFRLPEGETGDFGFEHCLGTLVPKNFNVLAKER